MNVRLAMILATALVLASEASSVFAQAPGVEFRPRGQSYQVTIENGMDIPIVVKVAHPENNVGNYRYDLRPGEYVSQNFLGGDRVVIVWDRRGIFQFSAPVFVDQSGVLVVQSPYDEPVGAPANAAVRSSAPGSRQPVGAAAPAAGRAGALTIRPEGERPVGAAGASGAPRRPLQVQPGREPR